MKKLLALSVLGLALATFGCAGTQTADSKAINEGTKIKCPKCGVEFTVGEGLKAVEKAP
jgi:hypothetical protein